MAIFTFLALLEDMLAVGAGAAAATAAAGAPTAPPRGGRGGREERAGGEGWGEEGKGREPARPPQAPPAAGAALRQRSRSPAAAGDSPPTLATAELRRGARAREEPALPPDWLRAPVTAAGAPRPGAEGRRGERRGPRSPAEPEVRSDRTAPLSPSQLLIFFFFFFQKKNRLKLRGAIACSPLSFGSLVGQQGTPGMPLNVAVLANLRFLH